MSPASQRPSLDPGLPSPAWEELVFLRAFYSNSQVQVRGLDPAVREAGGHSN